MTRLNDNNSRMPFVVKIVADKFSEIKSDNHIKKIEDPQKLKEKETALKLTQEIVTKRRVEKELFKMRDEGIIPYDWSEKDMSIIARTIPKRIYDDCVKEENEIVNQAGPLFGKLCGKQAMLHVKDILNEK